MKKLFLSALALLAAVCLYATDLNIYASGLHATQSGGVTTIDYMLNAQATSLKVKFYQGTTFVNEIAITGVNDLKKGAHSVDINLSALPIGSYTWALEAYAAANNLTAPAQISYPLVTEGYCYYLPQDVVVDNSFESPYFGRIYVCESVDGATDGMTTTTDNQKRGIFIYNPDLTFANGDTKAENGYDGGINTSRTSRMAFKRLSIDENGYVYVASALAANKGVYRMNPADPTANFTTVLSVSETVNALEIVGSTLHTLEGITAGVTTDGYLRTYSLTTIPVGSYTSSTLQSGILGFKNTDNTMRSDRRGGLWIVEHRGLWDAPLLVHLNADGDKDFEVAPNINQGLLSSFTYRGSLAVNTTGDLLAVGSNAKVYVFEVTYGAQGPTLTEKYSISIGGQNTDGLYFDVAGNLYVVNAKVERFYALAFPKTAEENHFETPAPSTNTITWDGNVVHVESVALNETSASIVKNSTLTLVPSFTPANATNQNVSWESNHPEIASVSQTGLVTAVAPGEADITVTTEDGSKTVTCHVTVTYTAVTGIELNKTELALYTGHKEVLVATVSPNDATEPEVSWESSDPTVATVSSTGEVMAVAPGTATITATSISNNEKSAACEVTVSAYSMTFNTFYTDRIFAELSGKTIRRAIAREGMLYVLALDENEPYLYRINSMTYDVTVLPTDFCTNADANGLKLSDIALTSDGVLVGCNKDKTAFNTVNPLKIYKWTESEGVFTGQVWISQTTQGATSGNFNNAYTGETMAYSGSSAEGTIVVSAVNAGASNEIRLDILSIAGSSFTQGIFNKFTTTVLKIDNLGSTIQLNAAPDASYFVLDGSANKPYRFNITKPSASAITPTVLISSADNKAFSNFFGYGDYPLALTTHFDEGNNDGFVINEVINGVVFDVADNVDALSAEAATFAAAVGETWNNNAYVYMLRDDKLSVYTTGMIADKLYEIGSPNAWDATSGIAMQKIANNEFKGIFDFAANSFFGFTTELAEDNNDGGWAYISSYRFANEEADKVLADGSNEDLVQTDKAFKIEEAGRYSITVNFNTMKVKVVKIIYSNFYEIGDNQGAWHANVGVPMDMVEDNIFEGEFEFNNSVNYFAFASEMANDDNDDAWTWFNNNVRYAGTEADKYLDDATVTTLAKGNNSFQILPGVYTIRVDVVNNTVSVKQSKAKVVVSEVGYATYYNSMHAYEMPLGVEGYVFNAANGLVKEYEVGDIVPANVGLVLKAEEGLYELEFAEGGDGPEAINDLLGTDETVQITDDEAYDFYMLSLNTAGELNSVGFYWKEADESGTRGKAFVNGAHKAYLKLEVTPSDPGTPAPQRFYIFNGENNTTDILNVKSADEAVKFIENGKLFILREGVIYDATGRRVR